jgi:hypothetical protein
MDAETRLYLATFRIAELQREAEGQRLARLAGRSRPARGTLASLARIRLGLRRFELRPARRQEAGA